MPSSKKMILNGAAKVTWRAGSNQRKLLDMPKSHTWCKYNEVNITPLIMCVSDLQKESSKVESRVLLAGIFVTALACIISAVARTIHRRLNNHYTLMP